MNNLLGLPECSGLPVRDERPTIDEYTAAELWIRECYSKQFLRTRHPAIVTWQYDRFFFQYEVHDDVIDLVMTILQQDFRNPVNPRIVNKFKSLLKNNASLTEREALLKELGPGGDLKPDMLGIATPSYVELDGLEVGTVKTAKETYDELHHKLSVLRDVVAPQLRIELPALGARKKMSVPTSVQIEPSKWRLEPWQRILPLPVRVGAAANVQYVDWICYHPTFTWSAKPPTQSARPGSGGEDGLVIYHIHRLSAESVQLPARVKAELRAAVRRWQQQNRLDLTLIPGFAVALSQDKNAFGSDTKQLIGYLGAGALLLAAVLVFWELGGITAAALIAQRGLSALAANPETIAAVLRLSAQFASELWPELSATAPIISQSSSR